MLATAYAAAAVVYSEELPFLVKWLLDNRRLLYTAI